MQKEFSNSLEKVAERSINLNFGKNFLDRTKYTIGILYATTPNCTMQLDNAIDYIRRGILSNDCVPLVFSTYCAEDGLVNMDGGAYNLPFRELIADSTQSLISLHNLDGVVLLANHDNAVAGLMMGSIRTATPFVVSSIGVSHSIGGRDQGLTQVLQSVSKLKSGAINLEDLSQIERQSLSNGSFSHLQSMACLTEVLGVSLIGNGTIPALTQVCNEHHAKVGNIICKVVQDSIQPKMLLTVKAFENALVAACAISASLDCVLHLIALANECKIKLTFDTVAEISNKTPTLVAMHALKQSSIDFYLAGGVGAVVNQLVETNSIDGSTLTVQQIQLSQAVSKLYSLDESVVYPNDAPYLSIGSIAVFKGNIAEGGALARRTPTNCYKAFVAKCKVFDSVTAAKLALLTNCAISSGDAIVVRYEGPKGAPGMRDLYDLYALLCGYGMQDSVSIVTDGRLSFADGISVGYICSEAYCDGEISLARDNDKLIIDFAKNKIELDVSSKEFKHRLKKHDFKLNNSSGWLERYSQMVQPANNGAILSLAKNKK